MGGKKKIKLQDDESNDSNDSDESNDSYNSNDSSESHDSNSGCLMGSNWLLYIIGIIVAIIIAFAVVYLYHESEKSKPSDYVNKISYYKNNNATPIKF